MAPSPYGYEQNTGFNTGFSQNSGFGQSVPGNYRGYGANSAKDLRTVYPPGAPASQHSLFRTGPGMKAKDTWVNVWELILVPWFLLALILTIYLKADSSHRGTLWIVPVVLLSINAVYVYWRYKAGKKWEVVLGLLCFAAILAALIVGAYASMNALNEYYRLARGATYFNVLPTESGQAHNDATALSFSAGSKVDTAKTYGFVDGSEGPEGTIYCVAPISTGNSQSIRIQYWAAGTNCCFPRSNFACGAANDEEAMGALVYPKSVQDNEYFKKAIVGSQAAWGLQAGDGYLLVSWTNNPVAYANSLYINTRNLFLIFAVVYLLISTMVGCAMNGSMSQQ